MTTEETVLAWHWAKRDLTTQHSNEAIRVGETLSAKGELELCYVGMHASLDPYDALQYAPGSMLCRVELSGETEHGPDKLCARNRKVIAIYDADHLLHEFACLCAERALRTAKVEDKQSWGAVEAKRLWLAGNLSDADLAAAQAAAGASAQAAVWVDSRASARAAAWAGARAAAWAAAWDSAWAASSTASLAAASAAAWARETNWQRETLSNLIAEMVNP